MPDGPLSSSGIAATSGLYGELSASDRCRPTLVQVADARVPDDKRLFLLLRQLDLDDEQAYTFVQKLQNMASANLIARIEAKLDAQNA